MDFDLQTTSQALLEWIYDRGGSYQHISINDFVKAKDLPDDAAFVLANDLDSHGLANTIMTTDGKRRRDAELGKCAACAAVAPATRGPRCADNSPSEADDVVVVLN